MPARAKRLTAQQPIHGHAGPAQRAMALDSFTRIFGTSRNKTTRRWQPRRDYCFVELQERNKNDAHGLKYVRQTLVCRCHANTLRTPDKLKFVVLLHPLGLGYLRDDLTKLAKAMFLVREQQRSLRIQDPVVCLPQAQQVRGTAAKDFTQQAFGTIALD